MKRSTFGACVATAFAFFLIGHIHGNYFYHDNLRKERKKVRKLEAQHTTCCKLIQSIDSDYVMDVLAETDEWQDYIDAHKETFME